MNNMTATNTIVRKRKSIDFFLPLEQLLVSSILLDYTQSDFDNLDVKSPSRLRQPKALTFISLKAPLECESQVFRYEYAHWCTWSKIHYSVYSIANCHNCST